MDHNFSGFIWSPVNKYRDEILIHINKTFPVLHYYIYNFKNRDDFETSILDIYTTDDIEPGKVKNIKIKNMIDHGFFYIYFKFYIKEPKFRKKIKTGYDISQSVENIKKEIRNLYKNKVDNYIHDIIIHISDNFEQTNGIDMIMNKYKNYRDDEFMNLKFFLKHQYDLNIFTRVDMLVRKYTLQKYLSDKTYNFNLYNKMQKLRGRHVFRNHNDKHFKNLIESMENGIDSSLKIKYDNKYLLRDGSHRLSYYYFYEIPFIPICYIYKKPRLGRSSNYSYDWFSNKFSCEELSIIKNEIKLLENFLI